MHLFQLALQILLILRPKFKAETQGELLSFFCVHTWAMLSTITNPILYGWLNTNLKHLFRAMIPTVKNEKHENEETGHENLEKLNGNGVIIKEESTR